MHWSGWQGCRTQLKLLCLGNGPQHILLSKGNVAACKAHCTSGQSSAAPSPLVRQLYSALTQLMLPGGFAYLMLHCHLLTTVKKLHFNNRFARPALITPQPQPPTLDLVFFFLPIFAHQVNSHQSWFGIGIWERSDFS